MPEHRDGTPAEYALLESFLWRDFGDAAEWDAWAQARGLTTRGPTTRGLPPDAPGAFALAMRLRHALRALAAVNTARVNTACRGGPATDADGGAEAAEATATLNALIAEFGVRPAVEGGGRVALRATPPGPVAGPVAAVLTVALEAMRAGMWRRFKLCPEPSCRASFYDASKNAAKTWCEMATCGSRHKMRRLRARQRG